MSEIVTVASGRLRHRHQAYRTSDASFRRAVLLEGQATNLALRSNEFDNAYWTKDLCTAVSEVDAVFGTVFKLTATGAGPSFRRATQLISGLDQPRGASFLLKAGTATSIVLSWRTADTGSASAQVTLNLSTGAFSSVGSTIVFTRAINMGGGWWLVTWGATDTSAVGGSGSMQIRGWGDGTYFYAAHAQYEEGRVFGTSRIVTTSATVTRSADVLYVPFVAPPQATTGYFRFIERGTALVSGARLAQIGLTNATTDPRLYLIESGGFYRLGHDNGTTDVTSTLAAAPTIGQLVELRAVLNADGSVQLHQSIEEAAESSAAASAANALAAAWAGPRLYIGCDPAGANGGFAAFTHVRFEPGVKTLAEMRTLCGVS